MSEKKVLVGIDLGTTNSAVYVWSDLLKRGLGIENSDGKMLTASAVCIHSKDDVVVGNSARECAILYPSRTAMWIKRLMGKEKVAIEVDGEKYSPQQLSAFILKRLIKDVEEELDVEVEKVIITVPAYFDANARAAVKEAGALAGVEVEETLDEPVAIAISVVTLSDLDDKKILVWDIGGGTTDIVVIDVDDNTVIEEIIAGDLNLGGADIDKQLVNYIKANHLKDHTLDVEGEQELLLKAEMAKIILSQKEETCFTVGTTTGRVEVKLTRKDLDFCIREFLKKQRVLMEDVIDKMRKKGLPKLDKIILSGGSTRLPQIKDLAKELFPEVEVVSKDNDQAVAHGAAIYAKALDNKKKLNIVQNFEKEDEEVVIKDLKRVSARSYGIAAFTGDVLDIYNMIYQNDKLPAVVEEVYCTRVDNQKKVAIDVYESVSMNHVEKLENGTLLGICHLEIKGDLPKHSPILVELRLEEDGTLHVRGRELSGNTEVTATMCTQALLTENELGLQKEQIDDMLLIV